MSKSNLEEKIKNNYMISKVVQIYLTCAQIELLDKYNFKYKNHNIFYNADLNIYTSIENCYSFTNQYNNPLLNHMNTILYTAYCNIDTTYYKNLLSKFLNKILKEK